MYTMKTIDGVDYYEEGEAKEDHRIDGLVYAIAAFAILVAVCSYFGIKLQG